MTKTNICLNLQNVSVKGVAYIPSTAKLMNGFYAPFYKISEYGKQFLKEKWLGNEEMLYEILKSMENKNVQYQNIVKTLDQRRNEFQCGVDFLGFPIYVVHEVVFQNVNVRPEFKNMEVPCQIFLNSRQYNVKQH